MNLKNGIKPEPQETFGNMIFMGLNREKMYFDREKGERTDKLEARIYNVASSVQQGQIEVTLPDYVDLKEIDFNKPVELVNPRITARAQANGNFANIIYTLLAEDIVETGHKSNSNFEPKAKEQKEPVTAGSDKK
ncbi:MULTISPECIES: DUF961 family protein [Bacillaceae]|uniref:DUF961 domain-containing protein n=1 Tax=Alkalicoccobacillus plakortidis TaxID=444060 RepID=A0A9D5DMU6_9BACI|nr:MULTISPECIES: DUF961 family protein [Bacillaceae]KQL56964.1 hypothetical protein AN965_10905 [Alkalicoccobacillus plakortidis]